MRKLFSTTKVLLGIAVLGIFCFSSIFPSCSTANLSDVKVCTTINGSDCSSSESSFPSETPVIYCSAKLNNAPDDTKVTFEWKHNGESFGKADVAGGSGFVNSSYRPPSVFPPGKYTVTVKINVDNSEPVTKEFTVE